MLENRAAVLYNQAMNRPPVSLSNYQEVYDYYAERDPSQHIPAFLHRTFGALFHPRTAFEDDAEYTLADHFNDDGRVLLYANHVSGADPFVLASVVQHETVLHPLIANTVIPGHVGLHKHRSLRPFLDNFVAPPAYRGKDVARSGLPDEIAQDLRIAASKALVNLCITKADEGRNIGIFPSGSRKATAVRSGIGQIVCGLQNPDRFRLLPVGIDYSNGSRLRPNVFIGVPQELPTSVVEVTELVEASLVRYVAAAKLL